MNTILECIMLGLIGGMVLTICLRMRDLHGIAETLRAQITRLTKLLEKDNAIINPHVEKALFHAMRIAKTLDSHPEGYEEYSDEEAEEYGRMVAEVAHHMVNAAREMRRSDMTAEREEAKE